MPAARPVAKILISVSPTLASDENARNCPDILVQIAAVRAALDKVALGLVEGHVEHCMAQGAGDEKRRAEMTAELMAALGRLVS